MSTTATVLGQVHRPRIMAKAQICQNLRTSSGWGSITGKVYYGRKMAA